MPTPLSAGKKPKVTDRRYLRPTEARRLIEGTDTRLIQAFLGHADIRHTAHYTAISPRRLAAVRVR